MSLSEHLTLLVGENDAGKSNIVDAIRLAVAPVSGRRSIWFEADRDVPYDADAGAGVHVDIKMTFAELTASEEGLFMAALVDTHGKLVQSVSFRPDPRLPRRQWVTQSVGEAQIPDPEPDLRGRVAHIYLPPLRDAAAELDSGRGERLAEIFELLTSDDDLQDFKTRANMALSDLAQEPPARGVVDGVQGHLSSMTQPVRHRRVDLQHRTQELRALVRALRFHMAGAEVLPAALAGSGLGYANLLYIATVVLWLERAQEFDLMLFLVEEPEAHLHPQLQTVLLDYLDEQARLSAQAKPLPGKPSGRIQVIATTHSPQLASRVSTQNVVVVRAADEPSPTGAADTAGDALPALPYPRTRAFALGALKMTQRERRKVDRHLDATRAALLFARQVILVEGIAEAVLLRALADHVVFPTGNDEKNGHEHNRHCREQFRAISIIAVGGVDFVPFLRLVLHDHAALVDRVVVITDGDDGAGARRRDRIHELFGAHRDTGVLKVEVGQTTLEADLYSDPENEPILRKAFAEQHNRSLQKWDDISSPDAPPAERASAFTTALRNDLDLGKGDFAHVVAELIESPVSSLRVPQYLTRAISGALVAVHDLNRNDDS